MTHWQCLCPQFTDSRIAAHHAIWQTLAAQITKHGDQDFVLTTETPMARSGFRVDAKYSKWQPDGLFYNATTKTLHVLEFTRCSDARDSALLEAVERKTVKYDELV